MKKLEYEVRKALAELDKTTANEFHGFEFMDQKPKVELKEDIEDHMLDRRYSLIESQIKLRE